MATGALDANGIWQYGEDDSEATASALLNKLASSTSTTITRVEQLNGITPTQAQTARDNLGVARPGDAGIPFRAAANRLSAGTSATTVTFPAGRFNTTPRIVLGNGHITATGNFGNDVRIVFNSQTSTGFSVIAASAPTVVDWLAIQMTSTNGDG
jgi:hypothetical protein